MDFIVSMITNSDKVFTSDQLAASWGYYNTVTQAWNIEVMKAVGFPTDMLPSVIASNQKAGRLSHHWFDIPAGTPVSVGLGDLQCSVRSTMVQSETDAVLNISTSAQMAFIKSNGFIPPQKVTYFIIVSHTFQTFQI